jgi:hypothetical protein
MVREAPSIEVLGAIATETPDAHYLARARIQVALRDNPHLNPNALTASQLAELGRNPQIVKWIAERPELALWLANPALPTERIEATFSTILDTLAIRIPLMSDKDLLAALKLMGELGDKFPSRYKEVKVVDAEIARMSTEEHGKLILEAARSMGYDLVQRTAISNNTER